MWKADLDAIAATITSQSAHDSAPAAIARTAPAPAVSSAPSAAAPAASSAPSAAAPPPLARIAVPAISSEEAARIAKEWQAKLAGKTWSAPRKQLRLAQDGTYEFLTITRIAGLSDDEGQRRHSESGAWKVIYSEGAPHIELSGNGKQRRLLCKEHNGVLRIDGDPVTAAQTAAARPD
jgi:hypothetical protein